MKKITVIMFFLFLAAPFLSIAEEKKETNLNLSSHEQTKNNARFKRSGEVFNNKANKKIRARRLAKKEAKKAAKEKKKIEESQDKGEGQVKVKF